MMKSVSSAVPVELMLSADVASPWVHAEVRHHRLLNESPSLQTLQVAVTGITCLCCVSDMYAPDAFGSRHLCLHQRTMIWVTHRSLNLPLMMAISSIQPLLRNVRLRVTKGDGS